MNTNAEIATWGRCYQMALRRHLWSSGPSSNPPAALRLGRRALRLGLETLDVARVHERALDTVTSPEDTPDHDGRDAIKRADTFFRETIVPIEKNHDAAREAGDRIDRLTQMLRQRAAESSASDMQLEQAVACREAAEARAEACAAHHDELMKEALRIQRDLRDLMRARLSCQEGERDGIGRELRDEIAQALVGIDLCLLALKTSGRLDTDKTEKSILDLQRLSVQLKADGLITHEGKAAL